MPVSEVMPDGNVSPAVDPPEHDELSGIPSGVLLKMADDSDDPESDWHYRRAGIAAQHQPATPASVEDLLAAMPAIARIDELTHQALALRPQKKTQLEHADRFTHKDQVEAERKKVNDAAVQKAAQMYEEAEGLFAKVVEFGRPGKTVSGKLRDLLATTDFMLRWASQEDLCVFLDGVATHHPAEYAACVLPAVNRIIRRPPSHLKGWEKHLQAVVDRHPVVDVYQLQTDLGEHVTLARKILVGLLNQYVREDGVKRPIGSVK
jgi:hypothetical protein